MVLYLIGGIIFLLANELARMRLGEPDAFRPPLWWMVAAVLGWPVWATLIILAWVLAPAIR